MTFEECVNILPDELIALGYKMTYGKVFTDVTNFHLDNDCQDCLIRIVNPQRKHEKCICFAEQILSTDWQRYFYSDFNDEVYNKVMTAARNMVAQFKKYNVELKIDELSKDFV